MMNCVEGPYNNCMFYSCAAYSKALAVAEGDDYQQICVAFAMCAYQSQDIESAKKSLMKWSVLNLS